MFYHSFHNMVSPNVIQQKILSWYDGHKRSLPWRQTTNPYFILISEIMLQQTQVDRVIPKYLFFIKKYPTVQTLAKAQTAELIKDWSGLGYNRRIIYLQKCMQVITTQYDGSVPQKYEQLLGLPGIGPYTAAAICAFAYNQEVPSIDTNIRRVLIHELRLSWETSMNQLHAIAKECIPKGKSRDWHNALMDYGALVLTSKSTSIKPITKQTKFKGSPRWYRGKLLSYLQQDMHVTALYLRKEWQKEMAFVNQIVRSLEKDGLVKLTDKVISLP